VTIVQGNKPAPEIAQKLGLLAQHGLTHPRKQQTGKRAREVRHAAPRVPTYEKNEFNEISPVALRKLLIPKYLRNGRKFVPRYELVRIIEGRRG
jgi:hypothetical protein